MSFYKAANTILGESSEELKFELVDPDKILRVYTEFEADSTGYLSEVRKKGRLLKYVPVKRYSDIALRAKSDWKKTVLLRGYNLRQHVKFADKELFKRSSISASLDLYYIVYDLSVVDMGLIKWENWIEPNITFRDYASKDTADEFGDLMNEL